ncbi:MAG: choice-of-anchor J domain-containing protein, partial [Gammaproteobacteria bacterium]
MLNKKNRSASSIPVFVSRCLLLCGLACANTALAVAPLIDLDQNDDSGVSGADYGTVFIPGSGGVDVADTDTVISDADSSTLGSATITITNPTANDDLFVNGSLPAGITIDAASTSINLILTGSASLADYQTAIETVAFNNTAGTPASTTRVLTVTVEDDLAETGSATSIIAVAAASQDVFPEGFESGLPSEWEIDNGVWQVGTPAAGPGSCYSGTQCAGTVLDGNYPNHTDSNLISPTTVLPTVGAGEELHLRFWQWFSYYPGGGDNGQVWIDVWDAVTETWGGWTQLGSNIRETSGGWSQLAVELTAYAGETVRFQFGHIDNNDGLNRSGWYIDDITLVSGVPVFGGDFEGGWGDWWADNGVWQVGTPTSGPGSCYSGSQCAGTVLDGNYPNHTDSNLISPTTVLPTVGAGEELHL